jgi:hypothetical protein
MGRVRRGMMEPPIAQRRENPDSKGDRAQATRMVRMRHGADRFRNPSAALS